jgi:Fur family peroxide stress response transcriptional regulator
MHKYKDIGLKLTPQRLAILEYLEENKEHPSAEKIYRVVSEKFPTMSFATVYNTLIALRERGAVKDLTIDAERKRFDPNTSPHNHLICVTCKRIIDVDISCTPELPEHMKSDFEITGAHIEFYGICTKCKSNNS